jgi:RHH-type proline utilization regulon transcriptional repressor/proline dehydrogenase/delta 1-pyrroline-5-carboxylate dehydrogenase
MDIKRQKDIVRRMLKYSNNNENYQKCSEKIFDLIITDMVIKKEDKFLRRLISKFSNFLESELFTLISMILDGKKVKSVHIYRTMFELSTNLKEMSNNLNGNYGSYYLVAILSIYKILYYNRITRIILWLPRYLLDKCIVIFLRHFIDIEARKFYSPIHFLKNNSHIDELAHCYDILGESTTSNTGIVNYIEYNVKLINTLHSDSRLITNSTPCIAIKLSSLVCNIHELNISEAKKRIMPNILHILMLAKRNNVGIIIDAEELSLLNLTLSVFKECYTYPELEGYGGLGIAVQAYNQSVLDVLSYLTRLANIHKRHMIIRLVKGAYWNKESIIDGAKYKVFTKKEFTDISYLACAENLLKNSKYIYCQFATHNPVTISNIIARLSDTQVAEFNYLCGLGDEVYKAVRFHTYNKLIKIRVYTPIGNKYMASEYLYRRFLEQYDENSIFKLLWSSDVKLLKNAYENFVKTITGLSDEINCA